MGSQLKERNISVNKLGFGGTTLMVLKKSRCKLFSNAGTVLVQFLPEKKTISNLLAGFDHSIPKFFKKCEVLS